MIQAYPGYQYQTLPTDELEKVKREYNEAYHRDVLEPSIQQHLDELARQGITHFHFIRGSSQEECDRLGAELNRTCEMCNHG